MPIGTFTVTFELSGFKKALVPNVVITTGFNAGIDQKLELGADDRRSDGLGRLAGRRHEEDDDRAAFTADVLEKIPTARDPWQIIDMTPGVQAGLNVGGSTSGQQVGLNSRGTARQRAVEPRRRVDHRPVVELLAVLLQLRLVRADPGDQRRRRRLRAVERPVDQPGDQERQQRVQGLGDRPPSRTTRCRRATSRRSCSTRARTVSCRATRSRRSPTYSVEYGGPILKNKLWFWGAADNQDINAGVVNFFDANKGAFCADLIAAQRARRRSARAITYDNLEQVQNCLNNDKTVIKNLLWKFNYQLNTANKFQYLFQSDNKYRNRRGASATTRQGSDDRSRRATRRGSCRCRRTRSRTR